MRALKVAIKAGLHVSKFEINPLNETIVVTVTGDKAVEETGNEWDCLHGDR
jgi:hypothetical protein